MSDSGDPFRELVRIVARLRDPNGGCPWDLKQTHETLKPYLIEEAYEVVDAIERKPATLAEELGDVLLQVVLHAQIGAEAKTFTIDDVAKAIGEKLIRRHPHVFGTTQVSGVDDVLKNWEQIKKEEKKDGASVMEGIPRVLPALIRAQRAGDKASRLGVSPTPPSTTPGISDLARSFAETTTSNDKSEQEKLAGLLLWKIAQLGREKGIDTEMALQRVTSRFSDEFVALEKSRGATEQGKTSEPQSTLEHTTLWNRVLE